MPDPKLPLRLQYPSEYSSWRNMKNRAKNERVALDNRFIHFPEFLEAMGPKPDPQHTVDRFPIHGGGYTLDNVRWADKVTQANNRRNTVLIRHEGQIMSVSAVARMTGQAPDTIRKRA